MRERIEKLEEQARELSDQAKLQSELHLIIGRLEDFTSRVKDGLDQADWNSKRDIIRALVKRVEVEKGQVNVVFRVDQLPFESSPARGSLQHCRRRKDVKTKQHWCPLKQDHPSRSILCKSPTLLTHLTRPTAYEFSGRPNKLLTLVTASWKESLIRQRVNSRVF